MVSAQGPDGETIEFEVGTGLVDPKKGLLNQINYIVNSKWNKWKTNLQGDVVPNIKPYYWDDTQRCLKAGATDMWIEGQDFGFQGGELILIETEGATSADPKIREIVHLLDDPHKAAIAETDELFGQQVTHIFWKADDALKFDRDLTQTILAGNLIPATQGRRYTETFAIPNDESPSPIPVSILSAIARTGANSNPENPTLQYLYPLQNKSLVWLGQEAPEAVPLPEIVLLQQWAGQSIPWIWRRNLLQADPFENAFTIDPVSFRRIARNSDGSVMQDYDSDAGETIRFGDGIFGELPNPGDEFRVTYRVGGGASGRSRARPG